MKKNLRNKLAIGALCLLTAGTSFYAGRESAKVEQVSFGQMQGISGYSVVRVEPKFGKDQIFARRNSYFHWEKDDAVGEYFPVREHVENSYGKGSYSEKTIEILSAIGE